MPVIRQHCVGKPDAGKLARPVWRGLDGNVGRKTQRVVLPLYATRLLNVGMEVTRIQKLLGHEHLDPTMIYARVYDGTVEADYRKAMRIIEQQQMPLSDAPLPAEGWPSGQKEVFNVRNNLDNSV